jgi:hypothetical protein
LHRGSDDASPLSKASSALTASSTVDTFTRSILPASADCPASAQSSAGTRNSRAPLAYAPAIFCWIPPIGPTWPDGSIVPVPATYRPPVSWPGVIRSYTPSENIRPALGPPMSCPSAILTLKGGSNFTPSSTPTRDWLGSDGDASVVIGTVLAGWEPRSICSSTRLPGGSVEIASTASCVDVTLVPLMASMRSPLRSTPSAGAPAVTPSTSTLMLLMPASLRPAAIA